MSDSHGAECFICDESLNEGETLIVKDRGVNRLRESSAKRKLTAHSAFLNNVKEVRVHTSCQITFLCGNGLPKDFEENQKKRPLARRNQVYLCTQLSMKEKILSIVNARGDQWAQEILQRISTLPEGTDLVAADAAYHISCYRKLYSRVPTGMKRGYHPASNVDEAMEYIFSYLEDNSEE
ncbi:hypothetical protein JTE90_011100 [Oedothorax gibbosus]|uniref:Transposase n=1 Tax=Oedothorax gibbosus TaxID=931172 RepID=A0AAV6TWA9_9ARAC|nr:hypothetical protein JTE90_011100 [Oedothorax gibbosus]